MYIRTLKRQNKNGSITEYLQLAHNEWDKQAQRSTVKALINLDSRATHNEIRLNTALARA